MTADLAAWLVPAAVFAALAATLIVVVIKTFGDETHDPY